MDAALAANPENREALHSRGQIHVIRQEWDLAMKDFDRCIELDPKDAAAYRERGNTYADLGDTRQAMRDLTISVNKETLDCLGSDEIEW